MKLKCANQASVDNGNTGQIFVPRTKPLQEYGEERKSNTHPNLIIHETKKQPVISPSHRKKGPSVYKVGSEGMGKNQVQCSMLQPAYKAINI